MSIQNQQVPFERDATCENCGGESVPLSGETVRCFDCGRMWGDEHVHREAWLSVLAYYSDLGYGFEEIDIEANVLTVRDTRGECSDVRVAPIYDGSDSPLAPANRRLWDGLFEGVDTVAAYLLDRGEVIRQSPGSGVSVTVQSEPAD